MKASDINQKMREFMNKKVIGVFAAYAGMTGLLSFIGTYIGIYLRLGPEVSIAIYYIINIFLLPVLIVGYLKYNLDIIRDKPANLKTLFEGFTKRYFFNIVILSLAINLFSFLLNKLPINLILRNMSIPWIVIGFIFLLVLTYSILMRVSQTYYRIIDNPSAGSLRAIRSSIIMMRGRGLSYIWQYLSFLPLVYLPILISVLSRFVSGSIVVIIEMICTLLVAPRIVMSFSIWYDDNVREANLEIEECNISASLSGE